MIFLCQKLTNIYLPQNLHTLSLMLIYSGANKSFLILL